jgi:hypothetical protein
MATSAEREIGEGRSADAAGRDAKAPTEIPAIGWKEIAVRTWKESSKDNVSLVAAGVVFYGFLALVPLLGATVLTCGLIADPQTVISALGDRAAQSSRSRHRPIRMSRPASIHISSHGRPMARPRSRVCKRSGWSPRHYRPSACHCFESAARPCRALATAAGLSLIRRKD